MTAADHNQDERLRRLQTILVSDALREAGRHIGSLAAGEIAHLLEAVPPAERLAASENLDPGDLADLVQDLPEAVTRELIESLDGQHRTRLEVVPSDPEDTTGGLMNTDPVTVRPEVTLDTVTRYLRRLGDTVPTDTDMLFVVIRDDEYLGLVTAFLL